MSQLIEPTTLCGTHVILEPLSMEHIHALSEAAKDGEIWKLWYMSAPPVPDKMVEYIQFGLDKYSIGEQLPFLVREMNNGVPGAIVGSTRLYDIDVKNRRTRLGYTWYAKRAQRTAINTECKLLLLQHCFETLNCIAVEFCTHFMNYRSREAILRLGAKQDGILRNHMIVNGAYRDTVVFSIIESEWPTVKMHLQNKLTQKYD